MAQHAKLSASGADTWGRCPASVVMQEGQPNPDSVYAQEGTAAHHLAAHCLLSNSEPVNCIGQTIYLIRDTVTEHRKEVIWSGEGDPGWLPTTEVINQFVVDDDTAEHVATYLRVVRDIAVQGKLFVETRVPLDHITTEKDAEGTCDAGILLPTEIVAIDLKFGQGKRVVAENNYQGQMYAGGFLEWLDLCALADDIETVRIVIVQPRVPNGITEWVIPLADLRAFMARMKVNAQAGLSTVNRESPIYNPGAKQCQWCKAKAICPAYEKDVVGTVIDDFEIVGNNQAEVDIKLGNAAINVSAKATNERLGYLLERLDYITDWVTAVRSKAEAKIFKGEDIPGFKLVQGKRGNRMWGNEQAATDALIALGFKDDQLFTKKFLTASTACDKLLKGNAKALEKVLPLVTQAEGSATIAPTSDPRPMYVLPTIEEEFENVVPNEDLV